MIPAEEAALTARCRKGESCAWDELFDQYYASTQRFVFQLGYDFSWEDTEEICQETFLAVIKNMASFKGASRFQTWIFCIASNKARDYRQRQCAGKRGGGKAPISLQAEDPETGLSVDPPSQTPGADAKLMTSERMALVTEALDLLGNPCQELIELRYFADLGYEEIAQALNLNLKTVSSRLSKCLDKLEEIMRTGFGWEKSALFSV